LRDRHIRHEVCQTVSDREDCNQHNTRAAMLQSLTRESDDRIAQAEDLADGLIVSHVVPFPLRNSPAIH
jgi:hypothetical protein